MLAKVDRHYSDVPAHRPELGPFWPWIGAKNTDGYGVIRGEPDEGKPGPLLLAHRVALSIALDRPLGEGMFANHHCDNPPCVRPSHLYEGTMIENIREMNEKGRAVKPPIRRKRDG